MTKFYTNFSRYGNSVLEIGYENGEKFVRKNKYSPSLYVKSNKPSPYKTLQGESVEEIQFDDMREAMEFIKKYSDVNNFDVYGSTNFPYVYINKEYEDIEYDIDLIKVCNIDIEVGSENGFPDPYIASSKLTAITYSICGKYYVFGLPGYTPHREDVVYIECTDESRMIMEFLSKYEEHSPDILTGWNIDGFDIPYLYNRIMRLFGENTAKRLSPWRMINVREYTQYNTKHYSYELVGVSTLDYLELYKKFTYSQQESYRLDHIAYVELGEKKLDYSEYENLHQLYQYDYQKYIEYNIKDVELVDRLEHKMKLIEMVLALAYDAKTNYTDVFGQVKMWDTLAHNFLIKDNIVVPPKKDQRKSSQYAGAFVKDPVPNKYGWIASFDLDSLYPHLIMQYNISPETFIEGLYEDVTVDQLLDKKIKNTSQHCMTANGHFFRKDIHGFLPRMMSKMYSDRKKYKRMMLDCENELEKIKSGGEASEIQRLKNSISRYNNLQLAKKVQLNSAYGAIGNEWFRFFDVRQAEAITLSGQLSIRWIANKVNDYMNGLLKTEKDYIVAIDTDSIYVNFDPMVDKIFPGEKDPTKIVNFLDKVCSDRMKKYIDKCYEELAEYMNAYEQKMSMKREVIAESGIWTAKKRYALNVWDNEGVRYNEPKLKVMGLEIVKSSTPSSCREKMKEAVRIALTGKESDLHEFNQKFQEEFKKLPFQEIAFPRGVSEITKYKDNQNLYRSGTPIHVRASLLYNSLLEKNKLTNKYETIKDGEKIKFCYLKTPNPIGENVFAILSTLPKEFGLENYIDYDTQFEKAYLDPVDTIVKTFGWSATKQSSLMEFFE